jgi:hypothetical protein
MAICTVEGCTRPRRARGLCSTHHQAARERGEWGKAAPCVVQDCDRIGTTRGLCSLHYRRQRLAAAGARVLPRTGVGAVQERFWRQVTKTETCWLWTGAKSAGRYGKLSINDRPVIASRYSWELHYGPIPHGQIVCHHCDTPLCVNPAHLFLGSNADNRWDCAAKGRAKHPDHRPAGELHGRAKITAAQAEEIRQQRAQGAKSTDLARRYGISPQNIANIAGGKTWRHLL